MLFHACVDKSYSMTFSSKEEEYSYLTSGRGGASREGEINIQIFSLPESVEQEPEVEEVYEKLRFYGEQIMEYF